LKIRAWIVKGSDAEPHHFDASQDPTPVPSKQNDAASALKKNLKIMLFDAAPAPLCKMMRHLAAPAPAPVPKHW
jgi:hypothetical protein